MSLFLKIENAALLAMALIGYHLTGGSWWLFLLLMLAPDLSMIGYVAGPRVGAWCYNAVHTWVVPVVIGVAAWLAGSPLLTQLALILAAHIAADRALGYGLKHETSFKDTHLGRIG